MKMLAGLRLRGQRLSTQMIMRQAHKLSATSDCWNFALCQGTKIWSDAAVAKHCCIKWWEEHHGRNLPFSGLFTELSKACSGST